MALWLDDVRRPWLNGYIGAEWVKTADECIEALKTKRYLFASLDHDLSELATIGLAPAAEKNGMTVIKWLEEHPEYWPGEGVRVHSMNPEGAAQMLVAIKRHYGRTFQHRADITVSKPHRHTKSGDVIWRKR